MSDQVLPLLYRLLVPLDITFFFAFSVFKRLLAIPQYFYHSQHNTTHPHNSCLVHRKDSQASARMVCSLQKSLGKKYIKREIGSQISCHAYRWYSVQGLTSVNTEDYNGLASATGQDQVPQSLSSAVKQSPVVTFHNTTRFFDSERILHNGSASICLPCFEVSLWCTRAKHSRRS